MEIILESFLIFTALMFWIMFYNKKGLLAELQKTEKKITEKIIVLEDLMDKAKEQVQVSPKPQTSNTLLRVLSLDEAEEPQEEPKGMEQLEDQSSQQDTKDDSLGVTQMILEARENLKKIEISDNIQIKSFKDVVLMSKQIEFKKANK